MGTPGNRRRFPGTPHRGRAWHAGGNHAFRPPPKLCDDVGSAETATGQFQPIQNRRRPLFPIGKTTPAFLHRRLDTGIPESLSDCQKSPAALLTRGPKGVTFVPLGALT